MVNVCCICHGFDYVLFKIVNYVGNDITQLGRGRGGHSESEKFVVLLLVVICKLEIHFTLNTWVWSLCINRLH